MAALTVGAGMRRLLLVGRTWHPNPDAAGMQVSAVAPVPGQLQLGMACHLCSEEGLRTGLGAMPADIAPGRCLATFCVAVAVATARRAPDGERDATAAARCRLRRGLRQRRCWGRGGAPSTVRQRASREDWARLPPERAVKVAARERAALRLGDLSEEERQRIAADSDLLGPYRNIVLLLGLLALVAALRDLFFLFLRQLMRGQSTGAPETTAGSDFDSLGLSLFLLGAGAALLYAGNVLMAPPPVPTMEEVLQDMEEVEGDQAQEDLGMPDWSLLLGIWCYGKARGQCYCISQDAEGTFRFDEQLGGKVYVAVLSPKGKWLQGSLSETGGKTVGTIRVRPGEGSTAVSYFMETGGVQWGNKNVSCRDDKAEGQPIAE